MQKTILQPALYNSKQNVSHFSGYNWIWGPPTANSKCGPDFGDCPERCCSRWGWCGVSSAYCTNPQYDFRSVTGKSNLEEICHGFHGVGYRPRTNVIF